MDAAGERFEGEEQAGVIFADAHAYDDSRDAGEREVVPPCFAEY